MSEVQTPASTETPVGPVSVKVGHYTVTSTGSTKETAEQIRENLSDPDETSKAAATLGKKGAEARKAKSDDAGRDGDRADGASGSDPEELSDKSKADAPEKPLGKPRDDPRARMLEATRKEAEAKRERDAARAEAAAARAEAEAVKARLAAPQTQETAPQRQAEPGKPSLEAFRAAGKSDEDFIEAMTEWKAEQKAQEFRAQIAQQEQFRAWEGTVTGHLQKALEHRTAFMKEHPDFNERLSPEVIEIANNPSFAPRDFNVPVGPDHVIADEIILSGASGPRLLLHLSDHPEEVQRLRSLPSYQAVQVEMRLLARSLDQPPAAVTAGAAPKGDVSRARPPVRPVTGSPHTASKDINSDDVGYDEYRRAMASKR